MDARTNAYEYYVSLWQEGDVVICGRNRVTYATTSDSMSLICNAKEGTDEYRAIKRACMDVANAMRALDDVLGAVEEEGKC